MKIGDEVREAPITNGFGFHLNELEVNEKFDWKCHVN